MSIGPGLPPIPPNFAQSPEELLGAVGSSGRGMPALPPNFSQTPEERLAKSGLEIEVHGIFPTLRISIVTPLGLLPLFADIPVPISHGRYDEF